MTRNVNWIFFAGLCLVIAAVLAALFLSELSLLLVPIVVLVVLFFLQQPRLLFYALLLSIPWSFEYSFTDTLGTDLPDEPLMLLMAFVAFAGFILQWRNIKEKLPKSPLLILLLVGSGWAALTAFTSTHPIMSVKYLLAKTWYVLAFIGAPLLLKANKQFIVKSALLLSFSMLIATSVALVKHAGTGFSFITINEALSPFFRNHVNYSALLVCMIPLGIAFYRLSGDKRFRVSILIALFVLLAALLVSYARGAWLALFVGFLAYWLMKKKWLLHAFFFTCLITCIALFWLQQNDHYLQFAPHHDTTIFHHDFGEHLLATYEGKDVSTAERFYRWVAGVRMSNEKWLTGFGPATFAAEYKPYAVPAFQTWVSANPEKSTVHNYFLLLAVEQGIVGLLLFLLLLATMFWQAQKIYHRTTDPAWKTATMTITAILWMICTVNFLSDLIETDKVGPVFYLCLSFLIIADNKTRLNLATSN